MEAIILKKNVFSEGSEVITVFTREGGKLRAVGRSVKSQKSKLAFGLQQLFRSDLEFASSKRATLETITGVRVLETFMNLRQNEAAVNAALYATELVLKATADGQPNSKLYDLYLDLLRHLDEQPNAKHFCADLFIIEALGQLGYALDFQNCLICRSQLPADTFGIEKAPVFFSASRGGFACQNCASKIADASAVDPAIFLALSARPQISLAEFDAKLSDSKPSSNKALHKMANAFSEHILERDLKASRFVV